MPQDESKAENALRKLGQRLRHGFAKEHPVPQQSIETVKNTVREQWEQEQIVNKENKPTPEGPKGQRKPPEPEQER